MHEINSKKYQKNHKNFLKRYLQIQKNVLYYCRVRKINHGGKIYGI